MVMYDSKAPGVYIEEVSGGARPIQAVGTSTAGFVGVVLHPDAPVNEAVAVNNWAEFVRAFHVDVARDLRLARAQADQAEAALAREEKALQPAKTALDTAAAALPTAEAGVKTAEAAVKAARQAVDAAAGEDADAQQAAAAKLAEAQAALDPARQALRLALVERDRATRAWQRLQTAAQQARAAYIRAQQAHDSLAGKDLSTNLVQAVYGFFLNGGSLCYVVNVGSGTDAKLADGLAALAQRDQVAIVAAPGYTDAASYDALIAHCERLGDRVAVLDAPAEVADLDSLIDANRPPSSSYAACYFPWLRVRDPLTGVETAVPPSGHVAGVWARVDGERGVHKAPANTRVAGAIGLTRLVTAAEQGSLNQHGINCIRAFPGDGILVWGARTLSADPAWRYVNVRRLFNMVEESIVNSTRWIVFEPNDEPLWAAIRRDVTAFLTRIWRTGALQGTTAEQAFFVKCDAETNPQENIDAGIVTTVIGIAPVKPAEFVVFQIQQYQAGSDVEIQGG